MRTKNGNKPKTDFGVEVAAFCGTTGMTQEQLVKESNGWWEKLHGESDAVNKYTFQKALTGGTPAYDVKTIVRAFMQNYMDSRAGA